MPAQLDHLVIAARSLEEGVRWCEATLGAAPGPGGAHPLMGTHNRLLPIAGPRFERCYLEIIAIDARQSTARGPHQRRWFDLDDAALQAALAQRGPQLVHFVVRVPDAHASVEALAAMAPPIARGEVIGATRDTPSGRLEWQITVRDDGQRLFDGTLPTLIQWGAAHPSDHMPDAGIALQGLRLAHPRADALRDALRVIGLQTGVVAVEPGPPQLIATFTTPRGIVSS